jgi:hypothetical protein
MTDVETRLKLREHRGRQPLGEDVSELRGHRDVEDANISDGNALADEVEINLNMLGVMMLDGVGGEVDRAGVVAIDQGDPRQEVVQLQKQLTEPACLCHDVVLRLNTRTGDDVLALGEPGDEIVT